ncbi:hypothetical protein D9756_004368 [Leucocoprinus leucothites]|uniref:Nephrocystin 3-like N-terminal domain-containing protein n=1 Tax=Leucocoprinus leucothites TaxID=201217 RepID=A0A8H5G0S9_9AGAR|nr:hypothetical protein D9756_004368 [Leucoagaricus leucothites]
MSADSTANGLDFAKTLPRFLPNSRLTFNNSPLPYPGSRESSSKGGILSNAHNFVMHQPQFIDKSHTTFKTQRRKDGMQILFGFCVPEAAHDAGAREYAPRCHPGTRQGYIDKIVEWTSNPTQQRLLWMKGPAGVGKSAVAQSCADCLSNLGGAFFFSRPNKVTDPMRFFPSIAYQFALEHDVYRKILGKRIGKDPSLLSKSLLQQFHNLFVVPLQKMKESGVEFEAKVVIVDGLDECNGHAFQCDILQIIFKSIQEHTTPFLWAIFTRPEAHLISLLGSPTVQPLALYLELPVSSSSNSEISLFLTDELRKIQLAHGLPPSWPPRGAIMTLVQLSAGLFIYSSTVVRFISDPDSLGPESQLDAVLALESDAPPLIDDTFQHPLSELDVFYTLIMQQIPPKTLSLVQEILLLLSWHQGRKDVTVRVSKLLKLSMTQMRTMLRPLYSVLSVEESYLVEITFYHASFLDFLCDPKRSGQFCLDGCKPGLWRKMLASLEQNNTKAAAATSSKRGHHEEIGKTWLRLLGCMPLDDDTLHILQNFDFRIFSDLGRDFQLNFNADGLYKCIPSGQIRDQIIRPYSPSLLRLLVRVNPNFEDCCQLYVLGCKHRRVILVVQPGQGCYFHRFQSFVKLMSLDWRSWIFRRR